jgi:hypothetical protein
VRASAQISAHIRSLLPSSRSLLTLLVYAGGRLFVTAEGREEEAQVRVFLVCS